jgi:hypothetical protein
MGCPSDVRFSPDSDRRSDIADVSIAIAIFFSGPRNLSSTHRLVMQRRNWETGSRLFEPLGVVPGRLFLLTWEGDMPNDKPLKPDDFPVEVEGEELVTADGKPIAKAKTPAIAEDIADRLNEDDHRKEQDRWSA